MRTRSARLLPPPPPPPASLGADPAEHLPDARPPAARLGDRKLRSALLRYATKCGVPRRELEDVVQRALTNAWMQRGSLPPTPFELERWLNTITHHRAVDEHRRQSRRPLARPKLDAQSGSAGGSSPSDDDAADEGDLGAVVSIVDTLELRDGMRVAEAEVAKHPSWARAFRWTVRAFAGESYEAIALADAVTEETVRSAIQRLRRDLRAALPDVAKTLLVLALAFVLYRGFHKKQELAVPAPKPEHSTVAPTPAPVGPSATELRRRGLDACDAHAWEDCLRDLDRARDLDPAGDTEPPVVEARTAAARGLAPSSGRK